MSGGGSEQRKKRKVDKCTVVIRNMTFYSEIMKINFMLSLVVLELPLSLSLALARSLYVTLFSL